MNNFRYAVRLLWKSPTFALVSILTLALCIGANTAVYSIVDAVLFRPLPYPAPERLASVVTRFSSGSKSATQIRQTGRAWRVLHQNAKSVEIAAFSDSAGGVNMVSKAGPQYVQQQRVSSGFFHALGVAPLIGREFAPDEDVPNGPTVVILSHALWVRNFLSDPSVVGQKILLRGEPYMVTGVMPSNFRTSVMAGLWTPLRPTSTGEGGGSNYTLLARLHPGVTWTQADDEVARIGKGLIDQRELGPGVSASFRLIPLQAGLTAALRPALLTIWGAVGLVLLIGCVNIAGLLLTRSAARSREIATRIALGSGQASVMGQLLIETFVLSLAGAVAGLGVGYLALEVLKNTALQAFQIEPTQVYLSWRVLMFSVLCSVVTCVVFGIYPAIQTARVDIQAVLARPGSRAASQGSSSWGRRVLVLAEVALGVVLLSGAGLLLRTFANLALQPPGFDGSQVLTASLSLQDSRYATGDSVRRLYHESLDQIVKSPGVEAAGIGLSLPYTRALNDGFKRLDGPHKDSTGQITDETYVTPGFFEALRMRLMQGRRFEWRDNSTGQQVAIVNQAFARMYLAGESPLGLHLDVAGSKREIVGVVGDVQQSSGWGNFGPLGAAPTIYVPADQIPEDGFTLLHTWFTPWWVVRSSGSRQTVALAVQRAVAKVDPQLPFATFKRMDEVRSESVAFQRAMAGLVSVLAGLALLLAALGIYGLVANAVLERTRELGIRMALGATIAQGTKAVILPSLVLTFAGVLLGAVSSFGATRLISALLWGVKPGDPLTLCGVCVLLLGLATVASLIPGLRVAAIDPAISLRDE